MYVFNIDQPADKSVNPNTVVESQKANPMFAANVRLSEEYIHEHIGDPPRDERVVIAAARTAFFYHRHESHHGGSGTSPGFPLLVDKRYKTRCDFYQTIHITKLVRLCGPIKYTKLSKYTKLQELQTIPKKNKYEVCNLYIL